MDMQYGWTMDIQRGHAAEMPHRHEEWTCSIDMQNDMQHGQVALTIRHPAWTFHLGMHDGDMAHAALI